MRKRKKGKENRGKRTIDSWICIENNRRRRRRNKKNMRGSIRRRSRRERRRKRKKLGESRRRRMIYLTIRKVRGRELLIKFIVTEKILLKFTVRLIM